MRKITVRSLKQDLVRRLSTHRSRLSLPQAFLLPWTPLAPYGDELHYFIHGVRMLHGQLPYRDFFTFVPPGTDLLYLGIFQLFGIHAWVVQGIVVVLGFSLTCAILWVSTGILDGFAALLPGLLFLVFDLGGAFDATHHWWCALFVLLATGTLMDGRDRTRLAITGALCGVATLFTQTQGGLSLLAIALYLVWTQPVEKKGGRWRELGPLVFPFVLIVGAFVAYYSWRIGFHTLVYWTLSFPVRYFSTLEAHTPRAYFLGRPHISRIDDLLAAAPYLFVHLLVPLMYLLCLFRLFREKRNMEEQSWQRVFLITLVGLAMFASVVSAPTPLRLCVVAPPAVILCVWYFGRAAKLDRMVRGALWAAALLLIIFLPINRQLHRRDYLDTPIGRMAFLQPKEYQQVLWFAQRTHPGDSFFDNQLAAFVLSLESPGPLDYVTAHAFTRPEQVQQLISSMEAHRTQFIYLYPELYGPPPADDNLEPLRQYIAQNYHLAKADAAGKVWERN